MTRFAPPQSLEEIPTVSDLIAAADRTVAGLDKAKQRIAWILRRHMVAAVQGTHTNVPNLLVIGPTGGGKSYLLLEMIRACPLIWAEINATEYSDVGYIGRDLVTMYASLTTPRWRGVKSEGEPEPWRMQEIVGLAQRYGVILLDEFDKLRMVNKAGERQVGRALQAELLKLTEGAEVEVKRYDGDRGFTFRTNGVLHIAMGAFEGLEQIQAKIDNPDQPYTQQELMGLHMDVDSFDLHQYGFLPELIGRFNCIVPLPRLAHEAITRILVEQTIPRYQREFAVHDLALEVDPGAVAWIAGEVSRNGPSGARSITPLMEELTEAAALAQPGQKVVVTAQSASMHRTCEIRDRVSVAV